MKSNRITNPNYETYPEMEDKLHEHLDTLFRKHSKLLLLRIDFAYLKHLPGFAHQDIHGLCADMVQLENRLTDIRGIAGYSWVAEYGTDHRYHAHCAIFINGQLRNKPWVVFEEIEEEWKCVTESEGYAHRCTPQRHYKFRSEQMTSHDNKAGVNDMKYILSYMAKVDQKPDGRILRVSHVPGISNRGRPRRGF